MRGKTKLIRKPKICAPSRTLRVLGELQLLASSVLSAASRCQPCGSSRCVSATNPQTRGPYSGSEAHLVGIPIKFSILASRASRIRYSIRVEATSFSFQTQFSDTVLAVEDPVMRCDPSGVLQGTDPRPEIRMLSAPEPVERCKSRRLGHMAVPQSLRNKRGQISSAAYRACGHQEPDSSGQG